MKLQQGQLWKKGGHYFRIVRWERLRVEYKAMASPDASEGTLHLVSKKEFCRLIKGATLQNPDEAPAQTPTPPAPEAPGPDTINPS
jgi:hypothetical protein